MGCDISWPNPASSIQSLCLSSRASPFTPSRFKYASYIFQALLQNKLRLCAARPCLVTPGTANFFGRKSDAGRTPCSLPFIPPRFNLSVAAGEPPDEEKPLTHPTGSVGAKMLRQYKRPVWPDPRRRRSELPARETWP